MAVATSTLIALGAAAAAAAASAYNTRQTVKKADSALAEGIRKRAATQRRSDQAVDKLISETGKSRPDAAATLGQYQQALQGTEANAQAGQALSGLSKEYDAATTAGNANRQASVGKVAGLLSQIDAATQQREREGQMRSNSGMDLGVLEREAQGTDFLAKLKAQSVRRNPWLDAFAAGLNAYAGGMGGGTSAAGAATGSGAGGWSSLTGQGLGGGYGSIGGYSDIFGP